jgi:hypothetical protein
MIDVREDILVRLLEILGTIPNIRSVHRNNIDIAESQKPTAIVLDGDEESDGAGDVSMKQPHRPYNVQMTPWIVIAQEAPDIGSVMNTFRRELIKRVLTDAELNEQIVKTGRHGNGAIRYLGCQSDPGQLRSVYGGLTAQFMFKYSLKPDDL